MPCAALVSSFTREIQLRYPQPHLIPALPVRHFPVLPLPPPAPQKRLEEGMNLNYPLLLPSPEDKMLKKVTSRRFFVFTKQITVATKNSVQPKPIKTKLAIANPPYHIFSLYGPITTPERRPQAARMWNGKPCNMPREISHKKIK